MCAIIYAEITAETAVFMLKTYCFCRSKHAVLRSETVCFISKKVVFWCVM